jgi:hypothetical protein
MSITGGSGTININNADLHVTASGSRLGIGTTSPAAKLHVVGNVYATGNVEIGGFFGDGTLANLSANIVTLESDLSSNSSRIDVYESNIHLEGYKVGISPSVFTPSANLHVVGNVYASANLHVTSGSVGGYILEVSRSTSNMHSNILISTSDGSLNGEHDDAGIYLGTPFNSSSPPKAAIIAKGASSWSKSRLHFCLDNTASNDAAYAAGINNSRMVIESDGRVGISPSVFTPSANLHVVGNVVVGSHLTIAENNTASVAIGQNAGQTTQGSNSVAIGYQAGFSNLPSGCVVIGHKAGYQNLGSNCICIGNQAGTYQGGLDNTIILNASNLPLNTETESTLYIKPLFDYSGEGFNAIVWDDGSGKAGYDNAGASDDRLKHNEEEVSNALALINQLRLFKYDKTKIMLDADYNGDLSNVAHFKEAGFIAQEVLEIPELAWLVRGGGTRQEMIKGPETEEVVDEETGDVTVVETAPAEYKTVDVPYNLNYKCLNNYAIQAIQELSALAKAQQEQIATLTARIEALENNNP